MNRKTIRQIKTKLINEEKNFKHLFCNYIFNSFNESYKVYNMISNDKILVKKVQRNWLPKDFDSLCDQQCQIFSQNVELTFSWVVFMINLFQEKIELYNNHKKIYERYLFSKDYENAYKELLFIEEEICVSLWSTQQIFLIKEYLGGLRKNKEKLEEYNTKLVKNGLMQIIINYYSRQAESGVSYENYQESVKTYLKRFSKDKTISTYLNHKINLEYEIEEEYILIPLQIDSQWSIIDLYETTIDVLQRKCASDINVDEIFESIKGIKISNDYRLNNIKLYCFPSEQSQCAIINNEIYPILELYTIGKYSESKKQLEDYLKVHSEDFQAHILWVKCLIKLQEQFENGIELMADMYNIYTLSDRYNDAYLDVALHYKRLNGTSWKYKLRGMLDRKRNAIDSKQYKILTYLNDMYITPSFAFNMFNKENCVYWLKILSNYCLVASEIFLYLYEDTSIDNKIEDNFRIKFYKALRLIEQREYNNAITELELLLNKQDKHDYYHIEKIGRKLFLSYAAEANYKQILYLTVNLFFYNDNLIKKFDFESIKSKLYKLDDNNVKADIRYPVFIYIIDKNNTNKQKIAYSNYMDHNKFNDIEDVINKENNQSDLLKFFLYNICSINVVKRDTRTIESGKDAYEIRISILKHLINIDSNNSKNYSKEIADIVTNKNIKDNIKQINHSRIFVDITNIRKVYNNVFNEEFNKYLVVRDFENDIKVLDINDENRSDSIINIGSEIKLKKSKDVKYNQDFLVIKNLSERVLSQLLYNTEFGLNTFLSSRIRHGFCKSSIKTAFEECHLLSQKRYESDDKYDINTFWETKLKTNKELFSSVQLILGEFTETIEQKINEVKNVWIKIKYKDEKEGLFDYTTFITGFMLVIDKVKFDDFDSFYKTIIDYFEQTTAVILEELRSRIKNELSDFFVEQLVLLENKVLSLKNKEVSSIVNYINQCKSKTSKSMSEFSEIFYLEKNEYDDFSLDDVIETCIAINKSINVSFGDVNITKNLCDRYVLRGTYFPFFVDMINQLINNAIEHSKLPMNGLELYIETLSSINCDLSTQFKSIDTSRVGTSYLNIVVINNMAQDLSPINIERKIQEIFEKFNNPEVLKKYTQTEGGSGLYKLYTTLQYHIGEKYNMYYEVIEGKFKLGVIIEIDNLIQRSII